MADNIDELMNKFKTQDFKTFLSTPNNTNNTNTNDTAFIKALTTVIQNSGVDLGQVMSPYINGYYLIFMQTGDWGFDIVILSEDQLSATNVSEFFKARKIHHADQKYTEAQLSDNIKSFGNLTFPLLATDIDLPEPSKEYTNVSSRSQSITAYHKEILLPDFTISYIENQNLDVIRYHEMWHKTIELYRRGLAVTPNETKRDTDILKSYFYSVPYLNNIWVLALDVQFDIKALISLVGVKPVSMPLKSFLGNRSSPKMTVYNINYKASAMFYQFYKDTNDFIKKASDQNNILSKSFKDFLTDMKDNAGDNDYRALITSLTASFGPLTEDDLKKIAQNSSPKYQKLINSALKQNDFDPKNYTKTNDTNDTEDNIQTNTDFEQIQLPLDLLDTYNNLLNGSTMLGSNFISPIALKITGNSVKDAGLYKDIGFSINNGISNNIGNIDDVDKLKGTVFESIGDALNEVVDESKINKIANFIMDTQFGNKVDFLGLPGDNLKLKTSTPRPGVTIYQCIGSCPVSKTERMIALNELSRNLYRDNTGRITSPFGEIRPIEVHTGIDLGHGAVGSHPNLYTIIKDETGKVIVAGNYHDRAGNKVVVEYKPDASFSYKVSYFHLEKSTVKVGQIVDSNTMIGVQGGSGNTSDAYTSHSHVQITVSSTTAKRLIKAGYFIIHERGQYYLDPAELRAAQNYWKTTQK